MPTSTNSRADYGIDAPLVVLKLVVCGAIAISLGVASRAFLGSHQPWFMVGLWSGTSGVILLIAEPLATSVK